MVVKVLSQYLHACRLLCVDVGLLPRAGGLDDTGVPRSSASVVCRAVPGAGGSVDPGWERSFSGGLSTVDAVL